MTTTLASPALTAAGETHASPVRLIRAEIMKIRTTNTWYETLSHELWMPANSINSVAAPTANTASRA